MCTLTYFPKSDGFVVTQNRDESPLRPAPVFPHWDAELLFPLDPQGQGTWMARNQSKVVSILNGGFESHERNPPYRHSRGKIPIESLRKKEFSEISAFNNEGLEPYSLLAFGPGEIMRFTWDGSVFHREDFDSAKSHIWQSAPLYTPETQAMRRRWFGDWKREHPVQSPEEIVKWHRSGGEGNPETDICMNREEVRTTAITQCIVGKKNSFSYQNVLTGAPPLVIDLP